MILYWIKIYKKKNTKNEKHSVFFHLVNSYFDQWNHNRSYSIVLCHIIWNL